MFKRLVLILTGMLILSNCGGNKKEATPPTAPDNPGYVGALAKMGKLASDPFTQMAFEFDGNPPPEVIHEKLDAVLTQYGVELNNSNRLLAAKTLTALRKEQGHGEMSILEKMQTEPVQSDEKFDDAARRVSTGMIP